ncbi:MAG: PilZ domain-containing protein [Pyrinomonadaceae bacterium MAG19_C2-C3]|nr:PilZ domain-containing protein [Pyrinomonadaceae bacterium MAG19_C2-C3]
MSGNIRQEHEGKSRRLRERLALPLPVRVKCRETRDHEWAEVTRLIDVTPFGARFALTHATEYGRLLHLSLPLPRPLRCFDHSEDQYRVWVLVRFVKTVEVRNQVSRFELGVAFIGKHPPASYIEDPATRYEVLAPGPMGLWQLREMTKQPRPRYVSPAEMRPETRVTMPLEVTIEVHDANGQTEASEVTVTENVSRRGAAVFTSLNVERGRFVRLTSHLHNASLIAVVRGRRAGANGIPRLHLEFIDRQFPLDGVE